MSAIIERPRLTGSAEIRILTGLHIGAGNDRIEIGGIDNPVLKHPHTNEPYIPGSSIKGRIRFLLEWAFGKVRDDGKPWGSDDKAHQTNDPADPILRIFGNALKDWKGGPTRLIVRDAPLKPEWVKETLAAGLPLTEEKTEVVIDRIQGKAHDKIGPRQTERVPAGAVFEFAFGFRLYDTGDGGKRDQDCFNWFLGGLSLLEQDALGGSGSRGYGRIRFDNLVVGETKLDERFRINRFDREAAPAIYTF